MCGIAGFSLSPEENVNSKRLLRALLLGIEERGRDATGFAFIDSTGDFQVHKDDIDASLFVRRHLCLPRRAKVAIAHTRFATQGTPLWNANNHPIKTGSVVGVHNGHISNDWSLFKDIEEIVGGDIRIADVDSEAAFAALGWLTNDRTEVLEMLRGSAALAWMDASDHPNPKNALHLARVSSSPLIVAETQGGSVIFASTKSAIAGAAAACGLELEKVREIEEGKYLTVVDGIVTDVKSFKAPVTYSRTWKRDEKSGRFISMYDDDYEYWEMSPAERRVFGGGTTTYIGGGRLLNGSTGEVIHINDRRASSSMDRTADRLNAEEPDEVDNIIDAMVVEDDDEARYQEWLAENTVSLEAAIALDDDRDREARRKRAETHARFEAFRKAPLLNSYYLSDLTLPVSKLSEAEYLNDDRYLDREAAIEVWARGLKVQSEATRTSQVLALKGGARIGDKVLTRVLGNEYDAEIVAMPSIFPGGMYTLRVFIPNEERTRKTECIFVNRAYFDFAYAYEKQRPTVGALPAGPTFETVRMATAVATADD